MNAHSIASWWLVTLRGDFHDPCAALRHSRLYQSIEWATPNREPCGSGFEQRQKPRHGRDNQKPGSSVRYRTGTGDWGVWRAWSAWCCAAAAMGWVKTHLVLHLCAWKISPAMFKVRALWSCMGRAVAQHWMGGSLFKEHEQGKHSMQETKAEEALGLFGVAYNLNRSPRFAWPAVGAERVPFKVGM